MTNETDYGRISFAIRNAAKKCGFSSSGRAPPCQGGGSEFEPRNPLHFCPACANRVSAADSALCGCPEASVLFGSLAQLGEHLPYKQRVSGSIPLTPIVRKYRSRSVAVITSPCHGEDRGFDSRRDRQKYAVHIFEISDKTSVSLSPMNQLWRMGDRLVSSVGRAIDF